MHVGALAIPRVYKEHENQFDVQLVPSKNKALCLSVFVCLCLYMCVCVYFLWAAEQIHNHGETESRGEQFGPLS